MLRDFQQQPVVGFENGAGAVRLGGQSFKVSRLPRKDRANGFLAARAVGFGIDQFAFVDPNFSREWPAGDAEQRRTVRETFNLDDVHQAFALHPAKTRAGFLAQQRRDAILKLFDLRLGAGLGPEQVRAERINARAKLFVRHGGEHHGAQRGMFVPHQREHLQAVHLRHLQVADQEVERFAVQQ